MPTKKTSQKRKRAHKTNAKKGKVYIPAYKIIMLCTLIIVICVGLLFFTTIKEPGKPSISKRYENQNEKIVKENSEDDRTSTKKKKSTEKTPDGQKKSSKVAEKSAKTEKESPAGSEKSQEKQNQSDQKNQNSSPKTSAPKNPVSANENPVPEKSDKKIPSPKITEPAPPSPETSNPEKSTPATPSPKSQKYNFPQAKNSAQLIFVFDDGGQNLKQLKPFLDLPFPITVAVLPQLAHSADAAKQVRSSGNEVILHQPMQSVNKNINPGPGAITPDMTEDEIISTLFTNINEIGPVAGLNNHEGSAITADAEKMAVVLKIASENGIYFLDSRTNAQTQVPYVAKELGYTYYERNIFLDNEKTTENALAELEKGLAIANKNGSVIMIGHIWSADFLPAFLQDVYPELKAQGYTFQTVSKSKALKN